MQPSSRCRPARNARPVVALAALALAALAGLVAAALVVGEAANANPNPWVCWDPECNPPPPPPPPPPPAPPPPPSPPPPSPPPPSPPPPPAPPPPPSPPPPGSGKCVDDYDSTRGIPYRCNAARTAYLLPDGTDPEWYASAGTAAVGDPCCGIPAPAPYRSDRDYSSDPDFTDGVPGLGSYVDSIEKTVNGAAYNHDVCYGSQLGQANCDARWSKNGNAACLAAYGGFWVLPWTTLKKYDCLFFVRAGWLGMKAVGRSFYKPRMSSSEPAGVPWS